MSHFLAIIALIFVFSTPSLSQSNDCIFVDKITNEYKLDLSELAQVEMFYDDGNTYNYTYTVCSNSLECVPLDLPTAIVSLKQGEPRNNDTVHECWWLAQWDNGAVQPSYNPTSEMWSFEYKGMPCGFNENDPPRNTTINWRCNPETEYNITSAMEVSQCNYQIVVDSVFACVDIPPPYCKWYGKDRTGNDVLLDLSPLSGTTIIGNDASDRELVFAYTPCRNATKCDDLDVMIKLENVTTSDGCMRYIGIWEDEINGGVPEYDDGIWRFGYNNGQNCGELQSELYLYWNCNPNITSYMVERADIIEPCLYDITIATSLACV